MTPWKRKEVIGDCTLYLGDSADIVPSLDEVDSVITDPVWPNAPDGMFPSVCNPYSLFSSVMGACRTKRIAVVLRTDSDPRFLVGVPTKYRFVRHQNLEYVATGYLGRVLGGMEIVYGFGDPIKSEIGQRVIVGNGPKVQPTKERFDHPCVRNPEHMKFIVRWWSDENDFVLDPFMGSGTTGVACVKMGRRFIGIEIHEPYFDIACERIRKAYAQPDMFVSKPKITETQEGLTF